MNQGPAGVHAQRHIAFQRLIMVGQSAGNPGQWFDQTGNAFPDGCNCNGCIQRLQTGVGSVRTGL